MGTTGSIPDPAFWPRKVLLVASGMSPQVLTETLYALLHQETPFVPDEVYMITTNGGKYGVPGKSEGAVKALLTEEDGHFYRFCRDYGFAETAFNEGNIRVITGADKKPLEDIVTKEDNERAANAILSLVCELTKDDNCSLHISLAGGRKTMSYFTGYALSLYGRPQDRLSHVLVDADYEGLRDFYYTTPASHMIKKWNGEEIDAHDAEVSLADIPFIRLRHELPKQLIEGKQDFRAAIERMRLIEKPLSLAFGKKDAYQLVYCSGVEIKFTPVEYAFYRFIVSEQQNTGGDLILIPFKGEANEDYKEKFIEWREKCDIQTKETTDEAMKNGMDHDYFKQRNTRIKKLLTDALPTPVAEPYLVKMRGKQGSGLYGIDPAVLEFVE